jgi:hypothetical protein
MRAEVPADTRPGTLLLGGLRRGAVLVFLPVFAAGQALAWLTYAASGWYRPWSWFKIGLAETLASVRVPFTAGGGRESAAVLQLALGALTILVLVLAFRAGREQARGLETRPGAASIAGSAVGLGLALPMLVAALPITLGFPQFGLDHLEPVLWQAFALPLVVGAAAGAAGGLSAAREAIGEGTGWEARIAAGARGGATALWWGVVLSFVGFLVLAALSSGPTGAYARFVSRAGGSGAAAVILHATLLPNQSAMILATAMGASTTLSLGAEPAVTLTRHGVDAVGEQGAFLAAYVGAAGTGAVFPWWFAAFWLIPAAATVLGGRSAGSRARSRSERALRGVLGGVAFAVLVAIAVWASTIVVPIGGDIAAGSLRLGPAVGVTSALALVWGVAGGVLGAIALPSAEPPT